MITLNVDLKQKTEDFYNKFFSKAAKEGKEVPLEYCINKAWADATQRERFYGQRSKIIEHKNDFKKTLKDNIEKILAAETGEKKSSFDYDNWHKELCSNEDYGMTCGMWQKFINMTFKYMYCYKICQDENLFSNIEFENCHCPIDSVIAQRAVTLCIVCGFEPSDEIVSIARSGEINWNKMGKDQYKTVRENIQKIKNEFTINNPDTVHPTELEFDFLFW